MTNTSAKTPFRDMDSTRSESYGSVWLVQLDTVVREQHAESVGHGDLVTVLGHTATLRDVGESPLRLYTSIVFDLDVDIAVCMGLFFSSACQGLGGYMKQRMHLQDSMPFDLVLPSPASFG